MSNKKYLGRKIQEYRKLNGLTQSKLAEYIGIETGSLSAIESGRQFPSLSVLEKISKKLNIKLKAFFDFGPSESPERMKKMISKNVENLSERELAFLYKFVEFYK